ncbi:acetyl-CoA carboxylase biotin carboxyl carrier protein [Streptomyces netropsis]|uniref:acetyl-CoA carboxylase biotin carboxyl carrier protein n=1 Tax=Streptomyces netropsis TaxID=55404 RepID=UPI0037B57F05
MSAREDDSASSTSAALNLVRDNVLELLKGFDSPPKRLRVQAGGVTLEAEWPQSPPAVNGAVPQPVAAPAGPAEATAPARSDDGPHEVRAPSVGTFYSAPKPGAEPFVKAGDVVVKGAQIAIVEVMKLMIPVEADVTGKVARTLKSDGDPVEYDEPLFHIVPQGT